MSTSMKAGRFTMVRTVILTARASGGPGNGLIGVGLLR